MQDVLAKFHSKIGWEGKTDIKYRRTNYEETRPKVIGLSEVGAKSCQKAAIRRLELNEKSTKLGNVSMQGPLKSIQEEQSTKIKREEVRNEKKGSNHNIRNSKGSIKEKSNGKEGTKRVR